MSHHHHHHGGHQGGYEGGYNAPTYNYDPLQQAQMVPAAPAPAYGGYGYNGAPQQQVMPYQSGNYGGYPGQPLQYGDLQAAEHRHRQIEHGAEMGALGAIAFAAYEKHEEKVDPAHARAHQVEVQVAEAAALGLGGYALYEHHEVNKIHKEESHFGGGQHHEQHGRHHH